MLFTLLAFGIALGLLITFHELGHYAFARLFGVRIERFSVGFGKVLVQRTDRRGTQWALSAIPLGGYVKMLDTAPAHASPALRHQAFETKPLWQRTLIVAAGPAANLLLAVMLYAVLNVVGYQEPAAVLGKPQSDTAAAQAGLQGGEHIMAVDGQPVASWNQLRWRLLDPLVTGDKVTLRALTEASAQREYTLDLPAVSLGAEDIDPLAIAGLKLATPRIRIVEVLAGGAGEQSGLQPDDLITRVNNVEQPDAATLVEIVSQHPHEPLDLSVHRQGADITLSVTPQAETDEHGQTVGRIGVMLGGDMPMAVVRHGPMESVSLAADRTIETAGLSLRMLGRMVVGQASLRNLSGPVTIADYAGQTARAGWVSYVNFMALISVSIGVLNLLPVPMLDGGHLLFYAIEALRGGRPVSERWRERAHRIGLSLLLTLMVLAILNDFARLFSP